MSRTEAWDGSDVRNREKKKSSCLCTPRHRKKIKPDQSKAREEVNMGRKNRQNVMKAQRY